MSSVFSSQDQFAHFGINFAVLHTQLGFGITFASGSLLRPYRPGSEICVVIMATHVVT